MLMMSGNKYGSIVRHLIVFMYSANSRGTLEYYDLLYKSLYLYKKRIIKLVL